MNLGREANGKEGSKVRKTPLERRRCPGGYREKKRVSKQLPGFSLTVLKN